MNHKKHTRYPPEVIAQIVQLSLQGTRSQDIWKNSPEIFGYRIKQSTISSILKRNGVDAKNNSFRRKRRSKRKNKI